ncbi:MAG: alpha-amylase [Armatimonadetes bacterium]|nr:alpha-amylase [Armatimonadota bacterium]
MPLHSRSWLVRGGFAGVTALRLDGRRKLLRTRAGRILAGALLGFAFASPVQAQSGFDDDRVLLQGFYWESHRHGYPDRFPQLGEKKWYEILREAAPHIREGRFDMVWLPPPSFAGGMSAGYNPRQYYLLANTYGSFEQHREALTTLLRNGVEPIADIVINHRDGSKSWADFVNPDWEPGSICRHDEVFHREGSPLFGLPEPLRGQPEERPYPYGSAWHTYAYEGFRDLDHTNAVVRRDLLRYLLQLKSMGYRGWRYDMVHGFHARCIALYNQWSRPTFSVGEYDWDKQPEQRGWTWHTATKPGDLKTASSVFDFSTMFTLKVNKTNYAAWYGYGNGIGLIGDTTAGRPWKQRAVTFLENHDTGYRTREDGRPEPGHEHDSFANNHEVEQAYAYILTHPGVPCVYWKHYFDWGSGLREKIRALVNARKVAGVHSGSALDLQENAREKGVYAARVTGKKGELYVRIAGSDGDWQPASSGYRDYREYATGAGWKVWVKLPGNPAVKQATFRPALPVPTYRKPEEIAIPETWLK